MENESINIDASRITDRSCGLGITVSGDRAYISSVVLPDRDGGIVTIELNSQVLVATLPSDAAVRIAAEVAFRLPLSYTVSFYLNYLLKCSDGSGRVDRPYTNEELGAMFGSKGYDAEKSINQLRSMGLLKTLRDGRDRIIEVALVQWAGRLVAALSADMHGAPCPAPQKPSKVTEYGRAAKRAPKTCRVRQDATAASQEESDECPEGDELCKELKTPEPILCSSEWDVGGKAVFGSVPSREREYIRSKYAGAPQEEFISGMAALEDDFVNPCIDPDL